MKARKLNVIVGFDVEQIEAVHEVFEMGNWALAS